MTGNGIIMQWINNHLWHCANIDDINKQSIQRVNIIVQLGHLQTTVFRTLGSAYFRGEYFSSFLDISLRKDFPLYEDLGEVFGHFYDFIKYSPLIYLLLSALSLIFLPTWLTDHPPTHNFMTTARHHSKIINIWEGARQIKISR